MRRIFKNLFTNKYILYILIIIIVIGINYIYHSGININSIIYKNRKVTKDLEGLRIIQISDLHNRRFGKKQKYLVKKIKQSEPDLIFITGDLIDSRKTDLEPVIELLDGITDISPIYYIPGNHESRIIEYDNLINEFEKRDINILDNKMDTIYKDNSLHIIGIEDPTFSYSIEAGYNNIELFLEDIDKNIDDDELKILLSHRPEIFNIFKNNNIDLVFTGHTHGGQIKFPFIGGIIAPGQGFFPKYIEGVYREGKTSMIVNTGLGNSLIPFRTFNRPEIVLVELRGED